MDRYHIALYIHLLAFVVAAGASAVTKVAVTRRARARTIGEALDWHDVLASTSKLFPLCLAAFVLTGAWMLSYSRPQVWASGFVVAGLVGVASLLASGTFLAVKGRALRRVLVAMSAEGADRPAPRLVPPPLVVALPPVNTGIALAVAFDMVTKPASVPLALGVLVIGAAVFAAGAVRRPAPPPVAARGMAEAR